MSASCGSALLAGSSLSAGAAPLLAPQRTSLLVTADMDPLPRRGSTTSTGRSPVSCVRSFRRTCSTQQQRGGGCQCMHTGRGEAQGCCLLRKLWVEQQPGWRHMLYIATLSQAAAAAQCLLLTSSSLQAPTSSWPAAESRAHTPMKGASCPAPSADSTTAATTHPRQHNLSCLGMQLSAN